MAIGIGIGIPFGKKETPNPVAQAPVNTSPPVISPEGNQVIGTVFTSGNGSWFATRPLTFEYRWTRNGTPISGATSQTYTSVSADEGQTLRCEVRATNAFGVSSYIASSNSSTGVSLPVNTVAPVISGSTTLGSVLTTTNGTWTGTSPITFSYQWKRNGVSIGGATSSTYTLVAADSSANITCEVTGTNVAGSVTAGSNTITAQNFNPVNTIAPTLSPSGTQSTGTVITLGNGTWSGASPITFEYRWLRDNSIILGQTSNTYTIVSGDDLKVIKGEVRATNALSTSAYVTTSNQVDAVDVDVQAQAHFNRVIADGGVVPSGLSGVNAFFIAVKAIYGTSDITTAISVGLDAQVLGYKLGAGAGTTAGQAAQKLYSCSGASGDVVQTTAASQPLLLVHEGANYWFGSGVSGNYLSTPNATANQITGDIEIIAYIENYVNIGAPLYTIAAKGDTSAYIFDISSTNRLEFYTNGSIHASGVSLGSTYTGWVRMTRVASSGVLRFFTSSDAKTILPSNVSWTQSGTNQSTPSGNLGSNSNPLTIGGYTNSGNFSMNGKIYRATISNSIGGSPVVDFNPASYNAATSQTGWTSATGEDWTINTDTAATGYKGVLVDRTIVQSDGVNDTMTSNISLTQPFSQYVVSRAQNGGVAILGRLSSPFSGYIDYLNSTTIRLLNGTSLTTAGVIRTLGVINAVSNSSNSIIGFNSVESTGNSGTNNVAAGYELFGSNCVLINTHIATPQADNITQRTAIYNILKSMNNL